LVVAALVTGSCISTLLCAHLALAAQGSGTEPTWRRANHSAAPPGPGTLPVGPALQRVTYIESPSADSSGPLAPPGPQAASQPRFDFRIESQDVRIALELLAIKGNVNIVVSPEVTGLISITLLQVAFEEALDAIAKAGNLEIVREKNIIYVFTPEGREKVEKRQRPVKTRIYHLNYVRGADIESIAKKFVSAKDGKIAVTPAARTGIGGFLSSTGSGTGSGGGGDSGGGGASGGASGGGAGGGAGAGSQDTGGDALAGGDTLIVQDYEPVLQVIDQIVADLDVPPIQVMIEAVIVSVRLSKNYELGINFGVIDEARRAVGISGSGAAINAAAGFSPAKVVGVDAMGQGTGKLVAGFTANEHGLKFGIIDDNITSFVRALETFGKVNVRASPRLLVLNKQRAQLLIGGQLAFTTTTTLAGGAGAVLENVEFLDTGTQLRLRPFATPDGVIRMEIHPERSSAILDARNLPLTTTTALTTNVAVPDGMTVVIGGLLEDTEDRTQTGIPGLGRLPVVGSLFRSTTNMSTKSELVVFLTPHIWHPPGSGTAPSTPTSPGESEKNPVRVPAPDKPTGKALSDPMEPERLIPTSPVQLHCAEQATALRGQPYRAWVTVTNLGRQPAEQLAIQPNFPADAAVDSGGPAPLNIGRLAPGESRTIEASFTPNRTGTILLSFELRAEDVLIAGAQQLLLVYEPTGASQSTSASPFTVTSHVVQTSGLRAPDTPATALSTSKEAPRTRRWLPSFGGAAEKSPSVRPSSNRRTTARDPDPWLMPVPKPRPKQTR
jgi:type II secretory pathway component GspD/PulD (secretin)